MSRWYVVFVICLTLTMAGCSTKREPKPENVAPNYANGVSDMSCFMDFTLSSGHIVKIIKLQYSVIGPFYHLDQCESLPDAPIESGKIQLDGVWEKDWDNRNYCYSQRSKFRGDTKDCELINKGHNESQALIDDCYFDTAGNKDRPDLCENIVDKSKKTRCMKLSQDELKNWPIVHCLYGDY